MSNNHHGSNSNINNKDEQHGTILDTIREQTANIESYVNRRSFDLILNDELKKIASKERIIRESTVMIKNTDAINPEKIAELIEKGWTEEAKGTPPIFWNDKSHTFVQFMSKADKSQFVQRVKGSSSTSGMGRLNGLMASENADGNHFDRRDIKLEITNVREAIKPERIDITLKNMSSDQAFFSPVKPGKLHGPEGRKQRSLMIKVNGGGFEVIFNKLNGIIPYNSIDDKITFKLLPKINARPWSCRDCYFIGPNHRDCRGKSCAKCGKDDHLTKFCKSKTRYCTNCKRDGHRAKDAHCPIYTREIIKEIKRMNIPLEFLEDDAKRFDLVKAIIYK